MTHFPLLMEFDHNTVVGGVRFEGLGEAMLSNLTGYVIVPSFVALEKDDNGTITRAQVTEFSLVLQSRLENHEQTN